MRFLYLVFAVFLLVSLATAGHVHIRKKCPEVGYCSSKCSKADVWSSSADCIPSYCCIPATWKGK
ncbi:CYGN protein, partial [Trogon melanurus]|nr:CYGN protein [Trogon melanurus]